MILGEDRFFDAFKVTVCNICGSEVLAKGLDLHVREHATYFYVEEMLDGQKYED